MFKRTLTMQCKTITYLFTFQTKCTKHAMKIIKKLRLTNGQINNLNDPQKIMNEVNIMKALRHVSTKLIKYIE